MAYCLIFIIFLLLLQPAKRWEMNCQGTHNSLLQYSIEFRLLGPTDQLAAMPVGHLLRLSIISLSPFSCAVSLSFGIFLCTYYGSLSSFFFALKFPLLSLLISCCLFGVLSKRKEIQRTIINCRGNPPKMFEKRNWSSLFLLLLFFFNWNKLKCVCGSFLLANEKQCF